MLNLAKRPFVDTRPANTAAGSLALVAVILTILSWRTIARSVGQSTRTGSAIETLRGEIARLEVKRRAADDTLHRYDLAELAASARDANALAQLHAFSWTRFLSRLERVLPADLRVDTITMSRSDERLGSSLATELEAPRETTVELTLGLVSKTPDGMSKVLRAFFKSPYFERPEPVIEQTPGKGKGDGWLVQVRVRYQDRKEER